MIIKLCTIQKINFLITISMMLMITIDTAKKKTSKMKLVRSRIQPVKGWRPFAHAQKRSIFERLGLWRKLGHKRRNAEPQPSMFS